MGTKHYSSSFVHLHVKSYLFRVNFTIQTERFYIFLFDSSVKIRWKNFPITQEADVAVVNIGGFSNEVFHS